jgi:hypothetical protein
MDKAKGLVANGSREVIISFDTTGSMYPCLTQVRRNVDELIQMLFQEVPNIRIGIIAHGDYCDAPWTIRKHELSTNQKSLCKFVREVEPTNGGDAPECYELVLHTVRGFNWTAGLTRALILIGDDVPHHKTDYQNTKKLDWRNEAKCLVEMGVKVYSVQALSRRWATSFYTELARIAGTYIPLHQFSDVVAMIIGACFQQVSHERVKQYEDTLIKQKFMNRSLDAIFAALSGREVTRSFGNIDLEAVSPGRFQVLDIDEDSIIRQFVTTQGLRFKAGRGFYQLTKAELVQGTKEIILRHHTTGDFYTGKKARELLGLPTYDKDVRLANKSLSDYDVFIQSTSYTRKLVDGTKFLYEVDDWSDADKAA